MISEIYFAFNRFHNLPHHHQIYSLLLKRVVFLNFMKYKHVWHFKTKFPDRDTKLLFCENYQVKKNIKLFFIYFLRYLCLRSFGSRARKSNLAVALSTLITVLV